MAPLDKANYLIMKFSYINDETRIRDIDAWVLAKRAALIHVDELLTENNDEDYTTKKNHLEQVKDAIQNL